VEHRRQVWRKGKFMWSTGVGCRRGYVECKKQVWNEADVMCSTRGIEKQDIKFKKWKRKTWITRSKTTQRFMGCSIFLFFLAHITV
jgi:hypothetical protein